MNKMMKMGVFTYNDESYDFNFATSLSAYEKQAFVKTVVSNVVGEDGYDVIVKDLIFDFTIVEIFTNIDTSFINMKDDDGDDIDPIILIEHFLEKSNVVDIVKENMEIGLLDELNYAVELNIQYFTGIHPNPLNEAIANLIYTLENKINEADVNNMIGMAKKFASMTNDFTLENIVNAYMNSDVHKDNLAEIEEFKR